MKTITTACYLLALIFAVLGVVLDSARLVGIATAILAGALLISRA